MIRLNEKGKVELVELDKSTPIRTIYYRAYALNVYSEFNNQNNYIVGIRTSQGTSEDNHKIVIIEKDTFKIMATMEESHLTIGLLADIVQSIVTDLVPNAKILVERNMFGLTLIDELLSRDLKEMLIYKEYDGKKIQGIELTRFVIDTIQDTIHHILRNNIEIINTEMVVNEVIEYVEHNNEQVPLFGVCVFASNYYN